MVGLHLPVSMIPEWYLEIAFITIEYHSIPLKFSMVHLPVAMIPEWYLEIPFSTTDVLNGKLTGRNDTWMVFGNTIHNYWVPFSTTDVLNGKLAGLNDTWMVFGNNINYYWIPFSTIEVPNGTLAGRNDTRMVFGNSIHYYCLLNTIQYHWSPQWYTCQSQWYPEWYLEIAFITIEYHSVPLKSSMIHLPVAMIPWMVFGNSIVTVQWSSMVYQTLNTINAL